MKTVLFFIELTRNSCAEQLEGVFRYARKAQWHVQLVECGGKEVDAARLIEDWNPLGAIVEYSAVIAGLVESRAFSHLPSVFLDHDPKFGRTHHMIAPDPDEISAIAAGELQSLGFEDYAFVPFKAPYFWSRRRGISFKRKIASARKRFHGFDRRPGADLGAWLKSLPKPCGVFAANDVTAEEVVGAAILNGISIPGELAVLGVDGDERICTNANPPLSSIQLDFIGAGYLAASTLHDLIRGKLGRSGLWQFKPLRVIRRKSTAARKVGKPETMPQGIRRIQEFLRESAGGGISVRDVVGMLGGSRRTAEQTFRRQTGKTILEAMHEAIYQRACEFAADRYVRTQDVADLLGGISRDTLDRIFLKRTGKTFRAWRNAPLSAEISRL